MEQRKRESGIPQGVFGGSQVEDPSLRDDHSGTFARPVTAPPPAPIARVALIRTAPPPPPPGVLFASTPPQAILPPPIRAGESAPDLRALVASTYPIPALAVEPTESVFDSERLEFPDFSTRLDVPQMAPAPSSLLPLPGEQQPQSRRRLAVVALVVALGAAGWSSRAMLLTDPVAPSAPRAATVAPAVVVEAAIVAKPAPVEEPPVAVVEVAAVAEQSSPVSEPVAEPVAAVAAVPTAVTSTITSTGIRRVTAVVESTSEASSPATTDQVEAPAAEAVQAEPAAPSLEATLVEELPETLERGEVIEGIEMLRNEYQSCAGDLHGIAELKLTIANTGRVSHAVVAGAFTGTPQGSCLARTLRQARFRSFLQPRLEIAYPLAL